MRQYLYIFILFVSTLSCKSSYKRSSADYYADSTKVAELISKGDKVYAQKSGNEAFLKSMEYYDSALQIARKNKDSFLLAKSVFAKGRAYDAINKNPQKTIDYYKEAAALYAALPDKKLSLYIKHLVAHSYDKVLDSINCVKILHELFAEIQPLPDSLKIKYSFTAEMALISTVVKNYMLADSILTHLTKREWIKNDTATYDYLDHYYITKARMDVYGNNHPKSPYLDSVEALLRNSKNLSDSLYYSDQLWELNKFAGSKEKENYYLQINNKISSAFNAPEKIREAQEKLSQMEVAVIEAQRKAENEKARARMWFILILTGLLFTISLLAFFLHRRNKEIKRKQIEVVHMNQQLYQKNLQNELLNKEIHHRVKNNLQMIMSLVYMQESNTQTEEVKENMQNIRLRIESIASLHQQLMEQSDVVDLRKYIQYLVSNATNLITDNKKVITHLQVDSLEAPQKISFPLGLIINEWVTNSVKYARPANGILEITVSIFNGGNTIKVHYKDNGIPQTIKTEKKSLGLEIVNILVEQLGGHFETTSNNLYNYTLTIPITDGE